MRLALALAMATLTVGLAPRPVVTQVSSDSIGLESIHMIDTLTGWAVAKGLSSDVSKLMRTTDGGTRWKDVTPSSSSGRNLNAFRISVLSSGTVWVMPYGTGQTTTEIFRTVDGGRTWKSTTIPALTVASISFINKREGWLLASLGAAAGSEDVEIHRSTDGGETWIKVAGTMLSDKRSGLPFGGDKSTISFLNLTTGWITGNGPAEPDGLYLYVTRDGGRTWRLQNMPLPPKQTPYWSEFLPQSPKFFTPRDGVLPAFFALFDASGQQTGTVAVFYATHDGGATWTYTTPLPIDVSEVPSQAVTDMSHAWVAHGSVLHTTNDGGHRWATVSPGLLFANVKQLSFISPQIGWAVRQKAPFLLKTLDGGRTWAPLPYIALR